MWNLNAAFAHNNGYSAFNSSSFYKREIQWNKKVPSLPVCPFLAAEYKAEWPSSQE